jgi:hypothetical protein
VGERKPGARKEIKSAKGRAQKREILGPKKERKIASAKGFRQEREDPKKSVPSSEQNYVGLRWSRRKKDVKPGIVVALYGGK